MISGGKDLKTKPRKRNSSATWRFTREGRVVPWARLLQSLVNFSHPPLDSQKLCRPGCRPRVLRALCPASRKEDLLVRNWRRDTTETAGSPNPGPRRSFQVHSDQRPLLKAVRPGSVDPSGLVCRSAVLGAVG